MRKRSLFAALLVVGLCGSWAAASDPVPMPAVSVEPSFLAPYVTLVQSSDANGRDIGMAATSAAVPYAAGAAAVPVGFGNDYSQTATLSWSNNTELGLLCRADVGNSNFYYAGMNPNNKYFCIVRVTNGTDIENLATFQYQGFDSNLSYDITLSCEGSSLIATLRQGSTYVEVLRATDTNFTTGQLGAFMFKPSGSSDDPAGQWDDAMVRDPLQLLPGDANMDATVSAGDLAILAANYGNDETTRWMLGEFNGDGSVGVGDLAILAANYGSVAAPPAVTPEPATLGLLALGVLGLLRRR